jgi:hypothetical protein
MRSILSERNIVVVLFVLVFITFSLAHEDTKKMEQIYLGVKPMETSAKPLVKNEVLQVNNKAAALPVAYKE